jgi:hypothetical protein
MHTRASASLYGRENPGRGAERRATTDKKFFISL